MTSWSYRSHRIYDFYDFGFGKFWAWRGFFFFQIFWFDREKLADLQKAGVLADTWGLSHGEPVMLLEHYWFHWTPPKV
jgi:hypothetical protein